MPKNTLIEGVGKKLWGFEWGVAYGTAPNFVNAVVRDNIGPGSDAHES